MQATGKESIQLHPAFHGQEDCVRRRFCVYTAEDLWTGRGTVLHAGIGYSDIYHLRHCDCSDIQAAKYSNIRINYATPT